MTPGVDRMVPTTQCQMEQTGRWRTRIPEFVRSGHAHRRASAPGDRERTQSSSSHGAKDSYKERNANKKTVTMAPVSRCMTSKGQYIARKPLASAERHTSILKNPLSQEFSAQEKHQTGSTREIHVNSERELQPHGGFKDSLILPSPSKPYGLSRSVSREDLTPPLTTADLRSWSMSEEPAFRSLAQNTPSKKHSRQSLSSPPLDVYSLAVPPNPRFSSTQRTTHAPSSCPSRKTTADVVVREPALKSSSKVSPPPFHQMSLYQANYWTCAIPTSLPPSPDRKSPNWDPDKEYEALLDYTYPLRPGHVGKRDSTHLGSHPKTDLVLEDSGIEIDRFCSSSTLSCLDQSGLCVTRGGKAGHPQSGHKTLGQHSLSSRELSQSKSSDGRLSSSLYSVDHIGLSVESLECDGKQQHQQWFHYKKLGVFSTSRSPTTFIPTLHVLPRPALLGDLDEEFLALPEQLQELQALSQHLKDISAQISQPVTSSWDSLERETSSTEKQSAETAAVQEEEEDTLEEEEEGDGSVSEVLPRIEEPSEEVKTFESRLHMLNTEVNRGSVKEMASIMDRLGGVSLSELTKGPQMDQEDAETKGSLMRHIQTFCANLEELIQWLYNVVQKMEGLAPPSVDIESVKTSLADYKNFQRDVHAHRPLTAAVLRTGDALLRCMNSTSPVLTETLVLIERQSQALETHAEHLFSSILSAMDSLTEASSQEGTECSE